MEETERSNPPLWTVIRGQCKTPGAEGAAVYGVRVVWDGGVWEFDDVDVSRAVVQRLTERLNACPVEPCHFEDVVTDFIREQG